MNIFDKCDVALLFGSDSGEEINANFFYYSSGCEIDNCILVLKKNSKILLAPQMNYRFAKSKIKFKVIAFNSKNLASILKKQLKNTTKIGLDFSSVSHLRFLRIKKLLSKNIVNISEQLSSNRVCKSADEISKISRASKIANEILDKIEPILSTSKSESQIDFELKKLCINYNVQPAFAPIVASGKNSANPHHIPSEKKLSNNELVLIDFGVKYKNYCSDLTRCFFIGECKEQKIKYSKVQDIFYDIIDKFSDFEHICQLAQYSYSLIKRSGLGSLPHCIGHGIGIEVHESPSIHEKSTEKLYKNTCLAIEPGWYGSKFGVRFEKDILFNGKKASIL
jgi:Xaa-Pro aminopeptidase